MSVTRTRSRWIWRRLAAAILLQAVYDASAGDWCAGRWLLEEGLDLAVELGISPVRVRAWLSRQKQLSA